MNQSILVTGSTGGLGQAMALNLAEKGYDLALHFHSNKAAAESLLKQANELGVSARLLQFNVREREKVRKVLEQDIQDHGSYYGAICNAGVIKDNAFPGMSGDDWDDVLRTNLDAFYNVLQPIVMPMVRSKKPARIITIASVSGLMGNRGQTNYSASKGGLIAATKSLAIELAKRKITVNCIAPGIIETEMTANMDPAIIKSVVPLRRAGKAKEVASLVSYLMSEDAAYITRQVISVNGGMC
jgi:3-oxoacyl-[acyl-carrier protein] reductase